MATKSKPFRMRKKPDKPKRAKRKVFDLFGVFDNNTLQNILDWANEQGAPDLSDVHVNYSHEEKCVEIYFEKEEDEGSYQNRLKRYKKRLKEYEEWKVLNMDFIETDKQRLKKKKGDALKKKLSDAESQMRKIQKEIEKAGEEIS